MGSCMSKSSQYQNQGPQDPWAFLPQDATPYAYPQVEYLFVNVPVTVTTKYRGLVGFSVDTTTDIDAYYPLLAEQYAKGYELMQFNMIPGTYDRHGYFTSDMTLQFQGIFARTPNQSPGGWQLYVIKSAITPQFMQSGVQMMFSFNREIAVDTSNLIGQISDISAKGGRLICLEASMQAAGALPVTRKARGMRAMGLPTAAGGGFNRQGGVFGIDLLFQLPINPSPPMYTYQAVNIPITSTVRRGIVSVSMDTNFDWSAPLQSYLSAGWKLVDIFYDNSMSVHGGFSSSITQNSIWFFEKEISRLEDPRPQYQGAVVEYYHRVAHGMGGVSVSAVGSWNDTVAEMGRRGWELSCIVATKDVNASGYTITHKLLLIFQRKMM